MTELRPCPYCGGKGAVREAPDDWVQCERCGAQTPDSATVESAVKKWNDGLIVSADEISRARGIIRYAEAMRDSITSYLEGFNMVVVDEGFPGTEDEYRAVQASIRNLRHYANEFKDKGERILRGESL